MISTSTYLVLVLVKWRPFRQNQWKKQGLAIIPTSYGIGFGIFLEQGGALVLVYKDGSVLVSHGGMEMGQVHIQLTYISNMVIHCRVFILK